MLYKNNPFGLKYTGVEWLGLAPLYNGYCQFKELSFGIRAQLVSIHWKINRSSMTLYDFVSELYGAENASDIVSKINYYMSNKFFYRIEVKKNFPPVERSPVFYYHFLCALSFVNGEFGFLKYSEFDKGFTSFLDRQSYFANCFEQK